MKPLHQFWHLLKFQLLLNPILFGLMFFMCLIGSGTVDGVWKYDCLGWNQYPSGFSSWFAFYFLWFLLFGPSFGTNTSGMGPLTGGPYLWTRAVDRKLILWVKMFFYWSAVAIVIRSGVTGLFQPLKPLQISFQGIHDNAHFQYALLADHRLGAHQFYDQWKNIIIEIPHGREYQIGVWLFQNLAIALLLVWLGAGLGIPAKWKRFLPWAIIFPMLASSFLNLFLIKRLGTNHEMPDPYGYAEQFILYANYHVWLWLGLVIVAVLIMRSVSRNILKPS